MSADFEIIRLERPVGSCRLCEDYAAREAGKPIVVMACEGACLRGELARLAANLICETLAPERTARLCLGGAFTKDTGQRALARNAARLVAIEGCPVACGSRMMKAVLPGLEPEIHWIHKLTHFDPSLFSASEMPEPERKRQAASAAEAILAALA